MLANNWTIEDDVLAALDEDANAARRASEDGATEWFDQPCIAYAERAPRSTRAEPTPFAQADETEPDTGSAAGKKGRSDACAEDEIVDGFLAYTVEEARRLSVNIRRNPAALGRLLEVAHACQVWSTLGYPGFNDYVRSEFGLAPARAYAILRAVREARALEEQLAETLHRLEELEEGAVPLPGLQYR